VLFGLYIDSQCIYIHANYQLVGNLCNLLKD
jgi:hypothetical protein